MLPKSMTFFLFLDKVCKPTTNQPIPILIFQDWGIILL